MPDLIQALVCLLIGVYFIIRRKSVAKSGVRWNTKFWGFSAAEKQYKNAFFLVGVAFIAFGVLIILGIIHFKQ